MTDFGAVASAFRDDPAVDEGRMFGATALKAAGKVFAMEVTGRLVVKLSRERVAALVAEGTGEPFDPGHGKVMKEWVAVPAGAADWLPLAEEARRFVER
jgi:TfoX/Sxy family transcriptional regulator of competence genes